MLSSRSNPLSHDGVMYSARLMCTLCRQQPCSRSTAKGRVIHDGAEPGDSISACDELQVIYLKTQTLPNKTLNYRVVKADGRTGGGILTGGKRSLMRD